MGPTTSMPRSLRTRSHSSRSNKTRSIRGPRLSTIISGSIITTRALGSTSPPPPPYLPSPCRDGQTVLPPCGSKSCSSSCWLSTGSTSRRAFLLSSSSPFFRPPSSSSPMSSGRNIYQMRMEESSLSMQTPPSSPPHPTLSTKLIPSPPCQQSPLRRRVLAPFPLCFIDTPDSHPSILQDSDGWFRPSFLQQLMAAQTRTPSPALPIPSMTRTPTPPTEPDPSDDRLLPTLESLITISVSSVDPAATLNRIVPSGSVPSAISRPLDISPLPALLAPFASQDTTQLSTVKAPLTVKSKVVPQMYNGGNVTEIPFVDESTKRELLSLLGDWYEPESIESLSLLCLPTLSSFLLSFSSSLSSAFHLVGSALLLRIASLLPCIIGPTRPLTILVPAVLYCSHVCFLLQMLFSDWLIVPRACPYSIMDSAVEF